MSDFKAEIKTPVFSDYVLDGIIKLMIEDDLFMRRVYQYIPASFFSGERAMVTKVMYGYFEKYNKAVGAYLLDLLQVNYAEKDSNKYQLVLKYLLALSENNTNFDYVRDTFGKYFEHAICKKTIDEAKKLVDRGFIEEAEQQVVDGFRQAYSLNNSIVQDFLESEDMSFLYKDEDRNFYSGLQQYDERNGGFYKGETVLVFADTNVGKSWFVTQIGKNALAQGKKVLHISLETGVKVVKRRYAECIAGASTTFKGNSWTVDGEVIPIDPFTISKYKDKSDFYSSSGARLWLHKEPSFNINSLKRYLEKIEFSFNTLPDLVIIDSPDQMDFLTKYSDHRHQERVLYNKFLEIADQKKITLLLVTQGNRASKNKKVVDLDNVGEGYDKVRIPDTVFTLTQSRDDKKDGFVKVFHAKARDGEKHLLMKAYQAFPLGQYIYKTKLCDEEETREAAQASKNIFGLNKPQAVAETPADDDIPF